MNYCRKSLNAATMQEECAFCNRTWNEGQVCPGTPLDKAVRFVSSLTKHIITGMKTLSDNGYMARLEVCETCDQRSPTWSCEACGCILTIKARWPEQKCPLNKWPEVEEPKEEKKKTSRGCCGS